jgi:hypothetical protein
VLVELSVFLVPVSKSRAAIMFVDNRARVVYGQGYVDAYDQGHGVQRLVDDMMRAVRSAYQKEAEIAIAQHRGLPAAGETLRKVRDIIGSRLRGVGARD